MRITVQDVETIELAIQRAADKIQHGITDPERVAANYLNTAIKSMRQIKDIIGTLARRQAEREGK